MSVRDIFAQRFTLLRNVYKHTYNDLSIVFQFNANTITEWVVSKRNFPNPEKLVLIGTLYGVSLDWLLGRTDTIYTHEVLASIEDDIIISLLQPIYKIPDEYLDIKKRKDYFPLPIRANIITFTLSAQFAAYAQVLGKDYFKKDNYESAINSNSILIRNAFADNLANQGNLVYRMLYKDLSEPVCDIEAEYKRLVKN